MFKRCRSIALGESGSPLFWSENVRQSHLLASTILSAATICLASAAHAQTATGAQAPDPQDATEVGEVVVTGTRLRLQDYVAANPVTSVSGESIEQSGQTNLTQFLQDVPSLVNSIDIETGSDVNANFNGLALLNLRNLGSSRTLVLVDGRRHVPSNPGTSAVDATAIPTALIERVEVLTGGASAIYGADGVSGVVNFILKRDFEGVDIRSQYGWSEKGGGDNTFVTGLVGHNFANGRANITMGFEYDHTQDLKFEDREFTRTGTLRSLVDNPDDVNEDGSLDNPNIVDQIAVSGVRYYDTSLEGSVYTNFFTAPTASGVSFLGNGQPFTDGSIQYGSALMQGGSGTPVDLFNDDLIPGQERYSLYSTASFELSDRHELFGEVKYTSSTVDFEGQPPYDYGLFISEQNPFLPANILADARTPGGFASTPAGGPFGPQLGLPGPGVLVARDNFYLGRSQQETENETFRTVLGLRGQLADNIDYEASYVFGRANQTINYDNVIQYDRYYAASDVVLNPATNTPTCRSNLNPGAAAPGDLFGQFPYDAQYLGQGTFTPGASSGCLPLNVFGAADAAAIDWIMGEGVFEAELTQHVLNAYVSGDSERWFSLPAGPISFVLGGEYRKEESTTNPDPLQTLAESIEYAGLTSLGRVVPTNGEYDVSEVFTEVSIPILSGVRYAEELTLSGAYRFSDYSTVGKTDTWNVAFRYRPSTELMFRGTIARAVRAPNINDLFRGRQQVFAGFSDPCDRNNRNDGENPTQRQTNCNAALTAIGVNPLTYEDTSSETIAGFAVGNPNLEPEEGDTQTIGVVFSPEFAPGLNVTVDYYDIEITGLIQPFTVQRIVNNCYDLPAGNEFCDLITRNPGGVNPGRINSFEQIPGNLAFSATRGIDFGIRYRLDPANFGVQSDIGTFNLQLLGSHLLELDTQDTEEAPVVDGVGVEGAPEWQATFDATWTMRNFSVNYGISWFDRTSRYSNTTLRTQPDIAEENVKYYDERFVQDIQARYAFDNGLEVFGGINNIGDQEPQPLGFGDASYPVSGLGRFFYVGARARLDSLGSLMSWR
jgi:outer membrane receptor protein involved in Fe transport